MTSNCLLFSTYPLSYKNKPNIKYAFLWLLSIYITKLEQTVQIMRIQCAYKEYYCIKFVPQAFNSHVSPTQTHVSTRQFTGCKCTYYFYLKYTRSGPRYFTAADMFIVYGPGTRILMKASEH